MLVPEKILSRPQRRLEAMEQLRVELLDETDEVIKRIDAIQAKIQSNLYNEASDEGLLDIDFAEYEDCFFVDVQQLRDLLGQEMNRMQEEMK